MLPDAERLLALADRVRTRLGTFANLANPDHSYGLNGNSIRKFCMGLLVGAAGQHSFLIEVPPR